MAEWIARHGGITEEPAADAAIKAAEKQNTMDDGQLAQVPSGSRNKSTTSGGN